MTMTKWHPNAHRLSIPGCGGLEPAKGDPKIILHTTQGSSAEGAIGAFRTNRSAPGFLLEPDGRLYQFIALNLDSYSLKHNVGRGDPQTNRAGIVTQIELRGFAEKTAEWTNSYYRHIADLCKWIHEQTGVPLHTHGVDFTDPRRMTWTEWESYSGVCGHVHVPGQDPENHFDPGRGFHIGKVL